MVKIEDNIVPFATALVVAAHIFGLIGFELTVTLLTLSIAAMVFESQNNAAFNVNLLQLVKRKDKIFETKNVAKIRSFNQEVDYFVKQNKILEKDAIALLGYKPLQEDKKMKTWHKVVFFIGVFAFTVIVTFIIHWVLKTYSTPSLADQFIPYMLDIYKGAIGGVIVLAGERIFRIK